MKIVHISTYPPPAQTHAYAGGVTAYTKNLVMKIPYRNDDDVYVLCNKIEQDFPPSLRTRGFWYQ